MRTCCTFLLLWIMAIAPADVRAQDFTPSLRWTGDVRVRSEIDMRDFNQKTPANTYTLLRTRLALEALPIEHVRVLIQARDSRVFGQERDASGAFNTLADSRNLDLHQGFVEISRLFLDNLMLRLGRMELSYANERMIGPVGWHNVGRTFDGGLVRIEGQPVRVDLFAMNTGEVQPYTPVATPQAVRPARDAGSDFYGAYASVLSVSAHKIDGYLLYQTNRDTTGSGSAELERATAGLYLKGKTGGVEYEAEVAYQFGRRRGMDVSAYMATGMVGYSMPDFILSWVGGGYELLSGTPAGERKYKSFEPLYPTAHKFHGFMDYFINIPAHTGGRGLQDIVVRAQITWSEKVTTTVWFHEFALAKELAGRTSLGREIDVVTLYRHNKNVAFEAGVSSILPSQLMRERFLGSDAAFWAYLMTTVSF